MQYRPLGRSGLKVSAVSLGSWLTFGTAVDHSRAVGLVAVAFDEGINLFDTADVYHRGEGEKVLGAGIAELPRHHLVLASKCFFPMSDCPNDRGLSRKHIFESLHGSLLRLGTDYLDLYQCHRHDPDVPMAETARAMHDLIVQGKVLYWGVSQWPAAEIEAVTALCGEAGWHPPISNQPLYNLFERGIEQDVLPASRRCGLGQIVYSPLAQGVLTGKYRSAASPPPDTRLADPRQNQFLSRYATPERLAQAQAFAALAQDHGLEPAALALAYLLRQDGVSSVIVGASRSEQITDNCDAVDLHVPADLAAAIERIFPA